MLAIHSWLFAEQSNLVSCCGIIKKNELEFSGILAELTYTHCTVISAMKSLRPTGGFRAGIALEQGKFPSDPVNNRWTILLGMQGRASSPSTPDPMGNQQINLYLHMNEQNMNPTGGIEYKEYAVGCASVFPSAIPVKDFLV